MRFLCVIFLCLAGPLFAKECTEEIATLKGPGALVKFNVEVADTIEERANGLMHRSAMPMLSGMLFVYEKEAPVAFWMKNTLIPLDMLFFDKTGALVHIHENAVPEDLTAIPSNGPAQYVLEINGGMSKRLGFMDSLKLQHPAISQSIAALPCEN